MIRTVAFNADDTLWDTQRYYDNAHEVMKQHFGRSGYSVYYNRLKGDMPTFGLGTSAVLKAFLEATAEINDKYITSHDMEVYETVKDILVSRPAEVIDGVREALTELRDNGYGIIILTKGQLREQTNSLEKSGLKEFVDAFYVMNDKDANEYAERVFTGLKINPEEFIMVGNTMKTDINPVLECGGRAIYVPRNHWHGENTEELHENHPRLFETDSIRNVPAIIKTISCKI